MEGETLSTGAATFQPKRFEHYLRLWTLCIKIKFTIPYSVSCPCEIRVFSQANSHSPYDELDGNNMMGNMPSSANPKISNHQSKLLPQKADELLFPFRRQFGSPLKYQNDLNGRSPPPPPPLPFAPQEIYGLLKSKCKKTVLIICDR
jgi:hypothetical protein